MIIEDDPILGKFIDLYPSNRLRLLIIGGGVLAVVWFVTTVALWQVEEDLASAITVAIISITTLGVGWYMAHWWNREVILFERGFSYRQGSTTAFIQFADVRTIRQRAERRAYFGGLIRRTIFNVTLKTQYDEIIVLDNLYNKIDDLSERLEIGVTNTLRPIVEARIEADGVAHFGNVLSLTADGLRANGDDLYWDEYGGFTVKEGALHLKRRDESTWLRVHLDEVENIRLLLQSIREKKADGANQT